MDGNLGRRDKEETVKMKILDIIQYHHGGQNYVFDEIPALTYERRGRFLIGSDDTGTFWDILCYGRERDLAFGGREFDLPMKDGSVTHCAGEWWQSNPTSAAEYVPEDLEEIGARTLEALKKRYIFSSYLIVKSKLDSMLAAFFEGHINYQYWEPREYEYWIGGKGKILDELKRLRRFKAYWDSLVTEESLEVANWHLNGDTEPLVNFYANALSAMDEEEKEDGQTDAEKR